MSISDRGYEHYKTINDLRFLVIIERYILSLTLHEARSSGLDFG